MNKKNNSVELAWYLVVFIFLLIWFTRIHPLSVLDGDDWTYISYSRTALPLWKDWNPSRVLPEVLMPLCSSIAAYALHPLLDDYLLSLTVMHGFVVAGFILMYLVCFGQMLKRLFSLSSLRTVYASALFLILHFLIFRKYDSTNGHMFYCFDLTCVYYYLIPSLLNASVVMCLVGNRDIFTRAGNEKKGLFCAIFYFAIFSNLPSGGILAVYSGSVLLTELIQHLWQKGKLSEILKKDLLYIMILAAWLVSAVFEMTGGRAGADMGVTAPFMQSLKETLYGLVQLPFRWSHAFILLYAAIAVTTLIILTRSKCRGDMDNQFLSLTVVVIVAIVAIAVYTVMLCAAVDLTYIYRTEYLFGLIFFIFLLGMLAFCYILQKLPQILWGIPIVLCVLASCCNTTSNTYMESNYPNLPPETCYKLTGSIIDQIVLADQEGLTEISVPVPTWATPDNWPHPLSIGMGISDALYEHGITRNRISVTCFADTQINETYNIPIY